MIKSSIKIIIDNNLNLEKIYFLNHLSSALLIGTCRVFFDISHLALPAK
jgi:hypothetical protein